MKHDARYALAADLAERLIPGHLGECVAVIILDHSDPSRLPGGVVDPNVSELVYTLLALGDPSTPAPGGDQTGR